MLNVAFAESSGFCGLRLTKTVLAAFLAEAVTTDKVDDLGEEVVRLRKRQRGMI
jgi:hypothetical protein